MNYFFLFLASYSLVFLLGFQQLNVQHRRYLLSAITSVGIAAANYFLFKLLPTGGFSIVQFVVFSSGGAFGIVSSMILHDKLMPKNDT